MRSGQVEGELDLIVRQDRIIRLPDPGFLCVVELSFCSVQEEVSRCVIPAGLLLQEALTPGGVQPYSSASLGEALLLSGSELSE